MRDVFISYARKDTDRVIAIAEALEKELLSVWYDHDILIGAKWERVLTGEVERARCVVL